ncbi:MAG: energy transducer TonB [Magnetococcales bacterium]|nr:energy transducer TonB [Magnetococcales bacterium]
MNRTQKQFLLSLGLAILLHLLLPVGLWLLLAPHQRPPVETVNMVHLVTLPVKPEPAPENPDALAEANHQATHNSESVAKTAPNAPAQYAASEAVMAAPAPQPKPVAKPAQPKPLAKKVAPKQQASVKHVTPQPELPESEPTDAESSEPEATPSQQPEVPHDPPAQPAHEPPQKAVKPPSNPQQPKAKAATPRLDLTPSVESLSQWERNRRFQNRSSNRDDEVVDLNTRQTRYVSYFTKVKQRIEWGWVYPEEAKRNKLAGNVGLVFTIQEDGSLLSVQITRSSGVEILDQAALDGVQKAAPFGPFPEDWTIRKLTIRATFEYIRRGLIWEK